MKPVLCDQVKKSHNAKCICHHKKAMVGCLIKRDLFGHIGFMTLLVKKTQILATIYYSSDEYDNNSEVEDERKMNLNI